MTDSSLQASPVPLPARVPRGHKGTFGTAVVVGGQSASPRVMIGGPALTALAALRVGAGLAVLALPEPILAAGLTIAPSATGLALPVDSDRALDGAKACAVLAAHTSGCRALAVGPGLGIGRGQRAVIAWLLEHCVVPLVIDADAINGLAELSAVSTPLAGDVVLTPHPGEFRRLATTLALDVDPVDPRKRPEAARQLAQRLGAVVVLKGPGTIISDGERTEVNETGNAALATAGTGDVLTGLIAGLIAQFGPASEASRMLTLFDCARVGVHLHGQAADAWAARHGTAGLLASELLDEIPALLAVGAA